MNRPRYGLSGGTVGSLNRRWNAEKLAGQGFSDFDDFVRWSAENGYVPYAKLKRIDTEKPHSPENSYWLARGEKDPEDTRPKDHPCRWCTGDGQCNRICQKRAAYWDACVERLRIVWHLNEEGADKHA